VRRTIRIQALLVSVLGLLALAGCRRAEPPVARMMADPVQIDLAHGRAVPLELRWELTDRLQESPVRPLVFVHLLDDHEGVVRTFDHAFPEPWEPGATVRYDLPLYHSAIAPSLAPGDYRLTVGLYDGARRRWALATEGAEIARNEYVVAQVRVPGTAPQGPRVGFAGDWHPVEPGGDRQVVARRWLSAAGAIELQDIPPRGGQLRLVLYLPEPGEGTRLVAEVGDTPAVGVFADCGGFEARLVGGGPGELALPIPPGTEQCSVHLQPTAYLVELETLRRLSVAVEQLAWQEPSGG
jgi:hypothetical protein